MYENSEVGEDSEPLHSDESSQIAEGRFPGPAGAALPALWELS